jgi:hypothetical protein
MTSYNKAYEKVIRLLEDNPKVRAIHCNRRSPTASLEKVKQMEDTFAMTSPIRPANAKQLIKHSEDLQFLQSMKGNRSTTFWSYDIMLAAKLQKFNVDGSVNKWMLPGG